MTEKEIFKGKSECEIKKRWFRGYYFIIFWNYGELWYYTPCCRIKRTIPTITSITVSTIPRGKTNIP
jgi:hypothetical protein